MDPRRKVRQRKRRHRRVRKKVRGTAQRPRLCVYKSLRHLHVQVINDEQGHTIVSASTAEKEFRQGRKSLKDCEAARDLGALIARRARQHGVTRVVFDKNGYKYHGRLKALADAAREAGLEF